MNAHARINWDLVDQFQQRFGWERTFKRARHFMAAYICQIRRPLPPLAAQGWGIAKRFQEGTTTQEECTKSIAAMWEYINQHEGSVASPDPNGCIMRALMWLLRDDNLGSGEKEPIISEEIHWFLFFAKKFEDHSDCASSLIEQHFSSEQYSD